MNGFDEIHAQLRQLMIDAAPGQVVTRDEPGDLVVRTPHTDPKTGERGWFGTVTIKKSYVAYHLMPLYFDPALGDGLSPALSKRRQGKTCFNFKSIDPALFAELAELTRKATISATA